jgi:hypothetical protein
LKWLDSGGEVGRVIVRQIAETPPAVIAAGRWGRSCTYTSD